MLTQHCSTTLLLQRCHGTVHNWSLKDSREIGVVELEINGASNFRLPDGLLTSFKFVIEVLVGFQTRLPFCSFRSTWNGRSTCVAYIFGRQRMRGEKRETEAGHVSHFCTYPLHDFLRDTGGSRNRQPNVRYAHSHDLPIRTFFPY